MHFLTFLYRKSGGNNFMDQNFSFNIPQQSFPLQIPDNPNSFPTSDKTNVVVAEKC